MPLTIGCTRCGKQLRLPETAAGQLCRCPSCFSTFTVVEQAGRFSVQPAATDDIPEVLPVVLPASPRSSEPKRDGEPAAVVPVPQTPEGAGPRPFVFRARILFDPEYRLAGEMQVRASAAGLELRDRRDRIYLLEVGSRARWLGGNRLAAVFGTREVTLAITQNRCQQAALARDLALFLGGKKPPLQIDDYRPRKGVRLLALVPLFVPIALIGAQVGAGLGIFVWICF